MLGKRATAQGDEYIVASESVALDILGFDRVRDVEIVSPTRVRFHLHEPFPDFMALYGTMATGAGWIVALCGDMQTMPGYGVTPAFHNVDIDADGTTLGLF